MELNARRPAHLHAGSVRAIRPRPYSRAEWRRHLHKEPPGLLRRLHGMPRPNGQVDPEAERDS